MEEIYLINKASFLPYEDLAVNVEEVRLKVFIQKAQELDLEPFMGEPFYYDMLNKCVFNPDGTLDVTPVAGTPQIYIDLLLGVVYENRNGQKQRFTGMIPALIYWSFARFIEADSVRYTATGPVTKHHDNADALKPSDSAKLVSQQRSVANAYINKAIMFLDIKRTDYPLWRYNYKNTNSRQPGPRMRAVDRTDVKRGYGANGRYGYGYGDGFLNGLI